MCQEGEDGDALEGTRTRPAQQRFCPRINAANISKATPRFITATLARRAPGAGRRERGERKKKKKKPSKKQKKSNLI